MLKKPLHMVIAIVVLGIAASLVFPTYWLTELSITFVYVIATYGTDIVVGRTGILSLSQASFIGIGAYVASIGSTHGLDVILQIILVLVICVVLGALMAIPTIRLSGMRLAIVTLLFGELFIWAVDQWIGITGGSEGVAIPPLSIAGINFSSPRSAYLLGYGLALGATLLVWQLGRGQWNRRLLAARDSILAAETSAIDVKRVRIVSFIFGASLCGFAGIFYAYFEGFIAPSSFGIFPSSYLLVAVLLGGSGTLIGPWLGAAYIVLLPDLFGLFGVANLYAFVGGVVLIAFTMLLPGGLGSVPHLFRTRIRRKSEEDGEINTNSILLLDGERSSAG